MPDIFISQEPEKVKKMPEPVNPPVQKEKNVLSDDSSQSNKVQENHLSAYLRKPKHVNFEIKDKEEKIELLLRSHPITNVKWILIAIIMVFAPIVLKQFPILNFLPGNYQFIAILGWYLIIISYILENFLMWYFNVHIVTDERIIDVDFVNMIYKDVSEAELSKIQDINYKMGGVVRTMFNYGDVFIQTAAETPNFDFLAVPNPDKVAKLLQELRTQEEQEAIEGRVR